jgi:hypothetical protein
MIDPEILELIALMDEFPCGILINPKDYHLSVLVFFKKYYDSFSITEIENDLLLKRID